MARDLARTCLVLSGLIGFYRDPVMCRQGALPLIFLLIAADGHTYNLLDEGLKNL